MWDTLYEGVDIILTLKKNFISPDFVGRLRRNLAWTTSNDRTKASWKKKWIALILDGKKQVALHSCHETRFLKKKSRLWLSKINLLFTEKLAAQLL